MPDKYKNYAELAAAESIEAYSILLKDTGSSIAIAAPHGGGIEPGTSEICLGIAAGDLSYYLFEGQKNRNNRDLHITSSNFDEPRCQKLLRKTDMVITVHGENSNSEIVYLGGRHKLAISNLKETLTRQGFSTEEHNNPLLQGLHENNICNIGRAGMGVQLEISRGLRQKFFSSLDREGRKIYTPDLTEFCTCIRECLQTLNHSCDVHK